VHPPTASRFISMNLRHRVSLTANVLLAVTAVGLAWRAFNRAPAPVPAVANAGKTDAVRSAIRQQNSRPYATIRSVSERRRTLIERLREMGLPNDILALVARVDFEVQWDARFKQCRGDMAKLAAVQLEMNKSKDAAMIAALGPDGFKQWDQKYQLWEAMSTKVEVSPAETDAIYALKKKLPQSQFDVEQARLDRTMDDAQINEAYDKAYSEYYANLKGILGDDRYAKSQQLDDAFVGGNLRHELAAVNPTDAQFQELFKVEQGLKQAQAELDHRYQDQTSSPEYRAKTKALDEAHDLEYQRVLGADAFNTLRKEQDPVYSQMKKYETLWGLDDAKIDQVYGALAQFQSTSAAYQSQARAMDTLGRAPAREAAADNFQKSVTQTQQALQAILGPASYNKMLRNHLLQFSPARAPQRGPF
jgi:hypothetical protein